MRVYPVVRRHPRWAALCAAAVAWCGLAWSLARAGDDGRPAPATTPTTAPTTAPAASGGAAFGPVHAAGLDWVHLSSRHGDLPAPGRSNQQTGCLVADLDGTGRNGIVVSCRQQGPSLVWYRPKPAGGGWDRYVIDDRHVPIEAGGAVLDVDGDGHPDLIFGGDWQSGDVWWWRNPGPPYDPAKTWERRLVKHGGPRQHHDQIVGDFKGTGRPQLAFWNQGARQLLLADVPPDPLHAGPWPTTVVYAGPAGEGHGWYAEGLAAIDVDGDGRVDLIAGNQWFKHLGGDRFKAIPFAPFGGRLAAGHLIRGSRVPQIVVNSGDGVGRLRWYECQGDPQEPAAWVGHDLLDRDVVHGHSLQIGDIDGDGNLDVFAAEMAKWTEGRPTPDHPDAGAWIFFGDGRGHFRAEPFTTGVDFHEARLADLDGDGRLDIVDKPYNWDAPRLDVWLQRPAAARRFDGPPGLQLYSVRDALAKDVPGTLRRVSAIGFAEVETAGTYGLSPSALRQLLDADHLRCTSAHFQYGQFQHDLPAVVAAAHALGAGYVVCPWIPHGSRFTTADAKIAATNFRAWAAALKADGLRFAYHPHGYEFGPADADGRTPFDVLVDATAGGDVDLELDVFWAAQAGQDPAALLRRYPGRIKLVHLKDLAVGAPTHVYTGSAPPASSVPVGTGQVDWPAVLRSAAAADVEHYYIEDESPDAERQVPLSLRYLDGVRF